MAALTRSIFDALQFCRRRVNPLTTPHLLAIARTLCSAHQKDTTTPIYLKPPLTIITGLDDSGIATLMNHIFSSRHGKRIAVIEDGCAESDMTGIDGSIVATLSSSNKDIRMLNNGCLYSTARGDFIKPIIKLAREKRDKLDHIVVKTTGPVKSVCEMFCDNDVFWDYVKLEGIVTLVDSVNLWKDFDGVVDVAAEQIAYADRIILNKTELVDGQHLEFLTRIIKKELNEIAHLTSAKHVVDDLDYVLGMKGDR